MISLILHTALPPNNIAPNKTSPQSKIISVKNSSKSVAQPLPPRIVSNRPKGVADVLRGSPRRPYGKDADSRRVHGCTCADESGLFLRNFFWPFKRSCKLSIVLPKHIYMKSAKTIYYRDRKHKLSRRKT